MYAINHAPWSSTVFSCVQDGIQKNETDLGCLVMCLFFLIILCTCLLDF